MGVAIATATVSGPIFKGEIGKTVVYTLSNEAGAVFDLTGYSAALILKKPSGSKVEHAMTVYGAATNGQVRWTTTAEKNFDEAGDWKPMIRVDNPGPPQVLLYFEPTDSLFVKDPDVGD